MKTNSVILWKGPSLLDGKPIVLIASGLKNNSTNTKTGAMLQTYILRDDIDPVTANRTGEDYSICGSCPHRGTVNPNKTSGMAEKRGCYVRVYQAPLGIYKALQRGNVPLVDDIASVGKDRVVRMGSYGDPAAIPGYVWDELLSLSKRHTGYTHQCNVPTADFRPDLTMISADSIKDAKKAWSKGYRTFRVGSKGSKPIAGEILCPASEEAGKLTTCDDCGLCGGSSVKAKSIFIPSHGNGVKYFEEAIA